MNITLGLDGSDSPRTVGTWIGMGVNEFFAGFVPSSWSERFGWELNLNRRCFGPEWQFRNATDLGAVIKTIHDFGAKVFVAFNTHQYTDVQLPLVREAIESVEALAPDAYIVADLGLMAALAEWGIDRPLHLSTGAACFNSETVRFYCEQGNVERVIFPRKLSLNEISTMCQRLKGLGLEYEAFIMGGRCPYNDELCFSWHSGEAQNLCARASAPNVSTRRRFPESWKDIADELIACPDPLEGFSKGGGLDRLHQEITPPAGTPSAPLLPAANHDGRDGLALRLAQLLLINCGLCAIPTLRQAGVHSVKIISRGEMWKKVRMVESVRAVLDLRNPAGEDCQQILDSPAFCRHPGSCFYDMRPPGPGFCPPPPRV